MWSLKIVKGSELADKVVSEWQLPQPLRRVSVGRDPANDWLLADRTLAISARHFEIVDSPSGPLLRDLSTNGTFVNGATARLLTDHLLRDGDRIELGPFDILVSGPPMPERPPVAPPKPATLSRPARSPGVQDTAPVRGGDPAAMLARGGGQDQPRLTEILLAAPPSMDSGLDLTRIREVTTPPKASASDASAAAAAAAASSSSMLAAPAEPRTEPRRLPPSALDARPSVPTTLDLTQALCRGLGVPASALEGQDLLQLVEQLAAAARSTQAALGPLAAAMSRAART